METSEFLLSLIVGSYAWIFIRMNKRIDGLEKADRKHDETLTTIKVSLARIETDLKYLVHGREK